MMISEYLVSPGGSDGKESACGGGDPGSIPGLGRSPEGGNGNPLQYSSLEIPQRSLAGYSPWGRKESDTTEQLTLYLNRFSLTYANDYHIKHCARIL